MEMHYGVPSFSMKNDSVKVYVTPLGGNVTVDYRLDGQEIRPYAVMPWWNEGWREGIPPLLNVLRGVFLCMPIGGDPDGYNGDPSEIHGDCANEVWDLQDICQQEERSTMTLSFSEKSGASIIKNLTIRQEENVLYEEDILIGYDGKYPISYHPILQLPDNKGETYVSISKPLTGFTTPTSHENHADGGYCLFKSNYEISDMSKVPTVYGDTEDLTRQPIRQKFEEIVLFISDEDQEFCFSTITYPKDGYLYFQLKDPKVFQSSMMWISNGGRHYAPWNGRTTSILCIEEITAFFHFGVKASAEPNYMTDRGYRTTLDLSPLQPTSVKLISGIAKIPADFTAVKAVHKTEDGVIFEDENGLQAPAQLDLSFLF